MNISELIEQLQILKSRHGDIGVMIDGEKAKEVKATVFDTGMYRNRKPVRSSSPYVIFDCEYLVAEITSGER